MAPKRFSNPFHGVVDMITEMNRMSDTISTIETTQVGERERTFADAWSPSTDILAKGRDLVIRAELPGVKETEVSVSLAHGVLVISGERHREEEDSTIYYTSERFMGSFRREISLPEDIDDEDVEAAFGDGLLEVVVHGGAHTGGPRQIAIKKRGRPRGRPL
ncbi:MULTISPECIES: Hsp20/alpha crystallin family protein [unclassified Nocardiopsis]|uniref:Hsp20/alpha crystallin family protein n=1 Tax=unclassified Nocardiopsis TaxID=2649073 RepID=UPI00066AA1E1|nr:MULTISPECIES: Hsp20/alpha crystallin family protein [unclassified Nocardiopsis]MBQ1083795.1 Hsp20/alpha crystallin family protein [Nocardiopsis sp. B62]